MIPVIELIRLEENEFHGTFGVLKINKQVFCVTLEPSDQENKSNISSIPVQQYRCIRVNSPTFGETFEIINVPDRTHVLFHRGNELRQTKGCVLLAEHFGKLYGSRAVLNSGKTFKRFMQAIKGHDVLHLTIYEHY